MSARQFPDVQVWWQVLEWRLCSKRWTTRWGFRWARKMKEFRHDSRQDVVIAIDGSLFRFHPHFKNVMQSRISQLMGINFKFDLLLSEVGSPSCFSLYSFHVCLKLTDHAGFAFIIFIPGRVWTRSCPGCGSPKRPRRRLTSSRVSSSQFLSELPHWSSKPAVTRPLISKKFSSSTNCVHQISKIPKPNFKIKFPKSVLCYISAGGQMFIKPCHKIRCV